MLKRQQKLNKLIKLGMLETPVQFSGKCNKLLLSLNDKLDQANEGLQSMLKLWYLVEYNKDMYTDPVLLLLKLYPIQGVSH
jgi:hypothetical protein